MRTKLKALLGVAAVIVMLTGGAAVFAHADTPSQQGSGGMMQGGQGGMMGMMSMMQQMGQMMDTCNNMMQGMVQQHAPKAPNEGAAPEKKQ